jgi:hypothetical protein
MGCDFDEIDIPEEVGQQKAYDRNANCNTDPILPGMTAARLAGKFKWSGQ